MRIVQTILGDVDAVQFTWNGHAQFSRMLLCERRVEFEDVDGHVSFRVIGSVPIVSCWEVV